MHYLRDYGEHPGLYFVAATLLPLVSFVLLLLVGGLRQLFRSLRGTPFGQRCFEVLGGETPGRGAAYVATGAMALAFLCSAGGAIRFLHEDHELHGEHGAAKTEAGHDHAHQHAHGGNEEHEEAEADAERGKLAAFAERWSGDFPWLSLQFPAPRGPAAGAAKERPVSALQLRVGYKVDALTVAMFVMVTFIATLIHLFSMGYMADELGATVEDHQVHTETGHLKRRGRFGRFFLFLSLFCFSMLNLVVADNLFQVFVSWELVGVCSYLLVGFYYERQSASNAANKAFITNRVGDAGFIVGVLIIWTFLGTLNFDEIFMQVRSPMQDGHGRLALSGQVVRAEEVSKDVETGVKTLRVTGGVETSGSEVMLFPLKQNVTGPHSTHFHGVEAGDKRDIGPNPKENEYGSMPYYLLIAAGLGIFLGCVGKSAQFPLHVWLPDAMEGPTPVSALIHAATMVAAGVYLVGRCFPLFVPESRLVIAYTGGITLFLAATIAVVMTDIKKVLAYSTVSQLGYMMLALGVGGWVAGLFHLMTHAFFKALLFLGSGSVIYGCHHEQEMTKMGGLYPKMKITALTMLAGVLAIAGTPLFSGWYSKDAIVAQAFGFAYVHPQHILLFLLPLVTAGITTFYMFRMWFMTFAGEPKDAHVHEHAHESPRLMTIPLILLAICSICVAWGWPLYDTEKSFLGQHLHHGMLHGPAASVVADFGGVGEIGEYAHWKGGDFKQDGERNFAYKFELHAGMLALGAAFLGFLFASLIYCCRVFDPAETKEQFPALYTFLMRKWYVDEAYSALLVRPALVVGHWCKSFDLTVIDGVLHGVARWTVKLSRGGGWVDMGIVDGIANLIATVTYAIGARLRSVQTGYLRSYILFLVLAVVGIFALLSYFVRLAIAG